VRGRAPDNVEIKPKQVTVDATDKRRLLLDSAQSDNNLPDTVKAYDQFYIDWQFNSNYQQNPAAGWVSTDRSTRNPVYLTYAQPTGFPSNRGTKLYQTLVHIGSKSAQGKKEEAEVISSIWDYFKTLSVTDAGGKKLYYYKIPTNTGNYQTVSGLLSVHRDGQRTAWADLFVAVLRAQGITKGQRVDVYNSDGLGILVRNWTVLAGPSYPGDYPYDLLLDMRYDGPANKGQGNTNPPGHFAFHSIVRMEMGGNVTRYYDPSYGTGPFPSLRDWQNASLAGLTGLVLLRKIDPVTGRIHAELRLAARVVDTTSPLQVAESPVQDF